MHGKGPSWFGRLFVITDVHDALEHSDPPDPPSLEASLLSEEEAVDSVLLRRLSRT